MIEITPAISLHESELEFSFIRSPGPGGQNVNKVASAVQLRFNVVNSNSLPEDVRERLLKLLSAKLTREGDIVIKASSFRTQERNKEDAIERLKAYIIEAATPVKKRKKTKPTFASKQKRLQSKKKHSEKKASRRVKPE